MTQFVKTANSNDREHRRELATAINQILLGRLNNVGTVTLLDATTTTTITDPNISANSVVLLVPLDANGAGLSWYMSDITPTIGKAGGEIEITHADPGADAVFAYVLIG